MQIRYIISVSYTHLRAHETVLDLVCRLLLEQNKQYKLTATTIHTSHRLNTQTTFIQHHTEIHTPYHIKKTTC